MTNRVAVLFVAPSALAVVGCVAAPTAHADDAVPHEVRYTVTSDRPYSADIYYRDVDPATFVDYSHNPYVFSPTVRADLSPEKPWVLTVALTNPKQWATVVVSSGLSPDPPTFHCELAVDGVVVDTDSGRKGALCSIRNW